MSHSKNTEQVVTDWRMIALGGALAGVSLISLAAGLTWLALNKPAEEPDTVAAQAEAKPVPITFKAPSADAPSAPVDPEKPRVVYTSDAYRLRAFADAERAMRRTEKPGPQPLPEPQKEEARTTKADTETVVISLNRRSNKTEQELYDALQESSKVVGLDEKEGTSQQLLKDAKQASESAKGFETPLFDLLAKRQDLSGLPLRRGSECRTPKETAQRLSYYSRALRRSMRGFQSSDGYGLDLDDYNKPDAVSTLAQVLQVGNQHIRLSQVEALSKIKGKAASNALAQRALFDLSPDVRDKAAYALKGRPYDEYRDVLLQGFRYPWAPVADHATDALMVIASQKPLPDLVELLDQPDPCLPVQGKDKKWAAPQLVRINHLSNCQLCHAASFDSKDLVRGLIPTPGQPLREVYYESQKGDFVRADITYLRQDFSVMQPVKDAKPWPDMQRFDYVVRMQEMSEEEATDQHEAASANYPQRDAVLFALRGLTGRDVGEHSEGWKKALTEKGILPKR